VQRNEQNGVPRPFTKIILQNIRVYAVDQAVQRTSEGTEERSVAKTVSLVVTPQQASRMTTAENMGEVSLIPRNPDDDIIVDDAEQSLDDIFARSDAGNREKERRAFDKEEESYDSQIQKDMEQHPVVAAVPPFRMKIIYPNEVSRVDFDAETGEPLEAEEEDEDEDADYQGPSTSGKKVGGEDSSDEDSFAPEGADSEFPIDLKHK
jgi:hypothetical protein